MSIKGPDLSQLPASCNMASKPCSCVNCAQNIDQQTDEPLPPCKIDHVIYKINCSICGIQYVGKTKLRLGIRISQHRCKVKKGDFSQLVHRHFIRDCAGATFENARFTIIDRISTIEESNPLQKLQEKEDFWIQELNVLYPNGLNVQPEKGHGRRKKQQQSSLSLPPPLQARSKEEEEEQLLAVFGNMSIIDKPQSKEKGGGQWLVEPSTHRFNYFSPAWCSSLPVDENQNQKKDPRKGRNKNSSRSREKM